MTDVWTGVVFPSEDTNGAFGTSSVHPHSEAGQQRSTWETECPESGSSLSLAIKYPFNVFPNSNFVFQMFC